MDSLRSSAAALKGSNGLNDSHQIPDVLRFACVGAEEISTIEEMLRGNATEASRGRALLEETLSQTISAPNAMLLNARQRFVNIQQINQKALEMVSAERVNFDRDLEQYLRSSCGKPNAWVDWDLITTCSAPMIGRVLHILPPTSAAVLDRYLRAQLGRFRSASATPKLGLFLFNKIFVFVDVLRSLPRGRRYAAHGCMHILACCGLDHSDWKMLQALDSTLRELFVDSRDISAKIVSQVDQLFLDLPTGVREIRAACGSHTAIPGELHWRAMSKGSEDEIASRPHDIFERIRQKACEEVQMKIHYTIGTVLAAELTDLIVEAALVSEGLVSAKPVRPLEGRLGCVWEESDSN